MQTQIFSNPLTATMPVGSGALLGKSDNKNMKTTEQKITTAAIGWWKNHRPLGWSQKKHLENPMVNCMSPGQNEKLLAKSVAKFIKEKRAAAKAKAMIKDRTTAMTRDILTGHHDSPAKIRKAIRQFVKDKRAGKIKLSEEPLKWPKDRTELPPPDTTVASMKNVQ